MTIARLLRRISAGTQRLFASRAHSGPYRFLVRNWDGITDIDLAINVMGTDYFRREVDVLYLPIESLRSILVLAPHQDDEAIGAGGTLLLAEAANVPVEILFVTDGSQLSAADPPEVLVEKRRAEATEVCRRLGAKMLELGISNDRFDVELRTLERLSEMVWKVNPQVLMIPWILDYPPVHRLVNHLLFLADARYGLPDLEIWGYQVHNGLYPNGYVDITDVAEEKRSLLEVYRSQLDHYWRYDHLAMGMGAWNSRYLPIELGNPQARYAEVFFALPKREYLGLVERFYLKDLGKTYRDRLDVANSARAIHEKATGSRL